MADAPHADYIVFQHDKVCQTCQLRWPCPTFEAATVCSRMLGPLTPSQRAEVLSWLHQLSSEAHPVCSACRQRHKRQTFMVLGLRASTCPNMQAGEVKLVPAEPVPSEGARDG